MAEPTRLTIRFEGEEPGLKQHRLSVGLFVKPLDQLVRALRRIASGIDSDAWGPAGYGRRGGRFTSETQGIDWELTGLNGYSADAPLEITGIVVQREETPPLPFPYPESTQLTDQAVEKLLIALEKESAGESYYELVRNYLHSLPLGIARQEYRASTTRGQELRPVIISEIHLPELEPERTHELPYFEEVSGNIIGVGFDPGENEVRIRSAVPSPLILAATNEQVNKAIELRGNPIAAFFVRNPGSRKSRLLQLRHGDEPRRMLSQEEAEEEVFRRWGGLLKRLVE